MNKTTARFGQGMRPNISISHQLNGRVKDYAKRNDLDLTEAYRHVIETGIEELERKESRE